MCQLSKDPGGKIGGRAPLFDPSRDDTCAFRTFYDCWSSSEDSREESCRDSRGTRDSPDRDGFDDYACALDGEYGLMSRSFRSFSFSKAMSTEKAMSQCLKAFYLVGNPKDYTLYEMNEKGTLPFVYVFGKCINYQIAKNTYTKILKTDQ
ncbi:hypothetical protein TSMEX_000196 [Taenia solium]|eukprot:TsM_000727800 transcript=TsM_000727800 gene=TsM_000727800